MELPAVELRRVRRSDFPLLARWLAEPLVARWWAHDTSPEAVEQEFGPCVDRTTPTDLYLGCVDGVPSGLVQVYAIASYPEYVDELTPVCAVPPGALSIDYLVGEPSSRGRGLGAALIAAAVAGASWYAAGELTPDNPIDPPAHVVHRLVAPSGPGGSRAGATDPLRSPGTAPGRGAVRRTANVTAGSRPRSSAAGSAAPCRRPRRACRCRPGWRW